jgi:type VI secretion system protein ImpK
LDMRTEMDDVTGPVTLPELATEIFLFALGMRSRADKAEFNAVHAGALRLFEEFERRAKTQRKDPEETAAAKYALAALVDEVVLSSDWPGREQWADDPLQLRFFGTYLAGEGFFERLDALRTTEKTSADVLEIYYLCLLLGFKGKYGISDVERLQALRKVVQNELERAQSEDPKGLAPHWQVTDGPDPQADRLPRWLVYACAAVLAACLLLYVGLFISIRVEAGRAQPAKAAALLLPAGRLNGSV